MGRLNAMDSSQHDGEMTSRFMPRARSRERFESVHAVAMTEGGRELIRCVAACLFRDDELVSGVVTPLGPCSTMAEACHRQRRLSSALNMQHATCM